MEISAIIAIVLALILIGFLSGLEIAFISANKFSLELSRKHKTYSGKVWGQIAEHPTRFIGTILIAVNTMLVVYGLLISNFLNPVWNYASKQLPALSQDNLAYIKLFFETALATIIILFIEFASKAFFRAKSNGVLSNGFITYLAQFFYWLFSSIASFFISIAEWILKYIFNVKIHQKNEAFSKVDLEQFMQQTKPSEKEEEISDINKELFENALSLGDTRIRECLVPRKEIISIPVSATIEEARQKFISTRLSKLVVFENNIDNIIGYIHQLELFKKPQTIREMLLPIPMVPESMTATDLMNNFSKEGKSIAWVIDEFGGTAGIVTMEDLLEELFGDIKDEYDEIDEFIDKQLSQNEYIFSGRMELDAISDKYGLSFADNDMAETLSGYIIDHNESIPKQKQRVIIGKYEFDILSVSDTRIETVKLKVLK